jgi:hypothetical protein
LNVVENERDEMCLWRFGLRAGARRTAVQSIPDRASEHRTAHEKDSADEEHDAPDATSHEPRHEKQEIAEAASGLRRTALAAAVDDVFALVRRIPAHGFSLSLVVLAQL